MNGRLASVAPGLLPDGDASVLCVHFAADGREHSMWYLDPDDVATPALTGFTAGLSSEWSFSAAGVARASVLRRDRKVLCDALLLLPAEPGLSSAATAGGTFGSLFGSDARGRDNRLLRAEGVPSYPAAMLANVRHRPLLASFARGIDLPVPLARHVHALLLRTAPATHAAPPAAAPATSAANPASRARERRKRHRQDAKAGGEMRGGATETQRHRGVPNLPRRCANRKTNSVANEKQSRRHGLRPRTRIEGTPPCLCVSVAPPLLISSSWLGVLAVAFGPFITSPASPPVSTRGEATGAGPGTC